MSVFALVLLACAVLLLLGAEWPRLSARLGADARADRTRARTRRRQKTKLTVVSGAGEADDDFAASVERDLAQLPVLEEPDKRSRR